MCGPRRRGPRQATGRQRDGAAARWRVDRDDRPWKDRSDINADRGARIRMLDSTAGTTEPFTGAEYLESIRDRREVYVYGDRVEDVTTHPAFRNTARSIARLYDALHD